MQLKSCATTSTRRRFSPIYLQLSLNRASAQHNCVEHDTFLGFLSVCLSLCYMNPCGSARSIFRDCSALCRLCSVENFCKKAFTSTTSKTWKNWGNASKRSGAVLIRQRLILQSWKIAQETSYILHCSWRSTFQICSLSSFCAVDKLTHVGFRARVKIASRIVSYRNITLICCNAVDWYLKKKWWIHSLHKLYSELQFSLGSVST